MAALHFRPTTDQLGFILGKDSEQKLYEDSQSGYFSVLAHRANRWKSIMSKHVYKKKSPKLQRFVRKGIPHEHRPMVWMHITGAHKAMTKNANVYQDLKKMKTNSDVLEIIDIDLPRTFPDNAHYQTEANSLHKQLRDVLTCFAEYNPDIGYCQGLNYVAGLMLLVMRDEEKTFWLLHTVVNELTQDYYAREPYPMVGLQADLKVLKQLVSLKCPEVEAMMRVQRADWSFVCTRWFVCLYIDTLPTETLLRVWDSFFYEGRHVLFKVALLLIKKGENSLLSCIELHHIVTSFQQLAKAKHTWYCHSFMKSLFEENEDLSDSMLMSLRDRYLKESKEEVTGTAYKLS